jgi:hypothetical protein
MSTILNHMVDILSDLKMLYEILKRISSVYMSYDKYLHISFRYPLYLNL